MKVPTRNLISAAILSMTVQSLTFAEEAQPPEQLFQKAEQLFKKYKTRDDAYQIYKRLADQGHKPSLLTIASYHLVGTEKFDVLERDKEAGLAILNSLMEENYPDAFLTMSAYLFNEGSWRDPEPERKARFSRQLALTEKAIELGSARGMEIKGNYYLDGKIGNDTKADLEKGIILLQKAAEKGSGVAMQSLAEAYGAHGHKLLEPDYQKVFDYAKGAYEKQKYGAFLDYARLYARGYKLERNYEKAAAILDEGAKIYPVKKYGMKSKRDRTIDAIHLMKSCESEATSIIFNVKLMCADRDSLRTSFKGLGMIVDREVDKYIADIYDSSNVVPGTSELVVKYTFDNKFAYAVYYLEPESTKEILEVVQNKYGTMFDSMSNGEFGEYYRYLDDGIQIIFEGRDSEPTLSFIHPTQRDDLSYALDFQNKEKAYIEKQAMSKAL